MLFSDSYYQPLKQLHVALSAAGSLIPLEPHQGALVFRLLGPTNVERDREREGGLMRRGESRPRCSSAASPQPLCADSIESNAENVASYL